MNGNGQFGLSEHDLELVRGILDAQLRGRPVYVFGSRATGNARPLSDIDLAVGGCEPLNLLERALLKEAFEESDLPMLVEVLDLNAIAPEFRRRISRDFVAIQAGKQEVAA